MTSTEKLCLKWNDFQGNTASSFRDLRADQEFTDVTLVCGDGQHVEAHLVVLISGSPFFKTMLMRRKGGHPLVYLRGVRVEEVVAVLDFLYQGEASVGQEELESFLQLASDLQIKGFTGEDREEVGKGEMKLSSNKKKKEHHKAQPDVLPVLKHEPEHEQENLGKHLKEVSFEHVEMTNMGDESEMIDLEEKDHFLLESASDGVNKWKCTVCGKASKLKGDIRRHVEIHIESTGHPCNICGKISRSTNTLAKHMKKTQNLIICQDKET